LVVRVRALFAILLIAGLAAGCQLIAGDFKVDDPVVGQADSATRCKDGEFRCNSEYLLECGATGDGWVLNDTCASADLCDSKGKHCQVCEPGDLRCDGASRQECDGSGAWHEVQACPAADMCNPTFCGNCTPGEYSCRAVSSSLATELWQCGKEGTWSLHLDDCASEGLCKASLDAASASPTWNMKCMPATCDAGAYSCDGSVLRHCRQDRTAWDVVDTCASKELCGVGLMQAAASQGVIDMCPPGCGTAETFHCNGMSLEQCRDDLTGFDLVMDCPANTECNPVLGACSDLCTAGEYQCNGATLRHCSTARHWEDVDTCASAALCQATTGPTPAGQCLPPGCAHAGDYQCEGATLSKCRDDLMGWDVVETCASSALCSALDKRCNAPACDPAELRCFLTGDHEVLRRCKADRTDWDLVATCNPGELCSNDPKDSGCKLSCDSSARCNGKELERCTPNGWVHQSTCATTDLCSCSINGTCALGLGTDGCGVVVCGGTLATYQCSGATLQKCSAGRNGWDTQANCGDPSLCYPGASPTFTNGYCAVCPTANELKCNGSTLTQCSPDRTMVSTVANCATYGCIDSGTADYCAACNTGQVLCSGPTLQKCSSDRRAFVNTTCISAALCDAANAQCDVCTANSNTCSGLRLDHCSSDGQTIQSQNCPKICDAAGGQCDGCVANTSRCANNVLYKCSSDGQTETPTTCATTVLCNASLQRCDTPTCAVGEHRCAGAQPQVCNANRNGWDNTTASACATTALCTGPNDGTCATPTCAVGEHRCNGAQPQVCNADRNGWDNSTTSACATTGLCLASTGTCQTPVCAVGEHRCNGAQPQVCNAARNGWDNSTTSACASTALCNAATGTCTAPTCAPNQTRCVGPQPQICKGDLTGYQDIPMTCASGALCDGATGSCLPPACTAGQTRCSGAQPQRCKTDLTGYENDGAACASAALCMPGGCIAPTCSLGQTRCNGAQPEQCKTDLSGWTSKGTACATPALCNATDGTCNPATCSAGQTRCNGAQPQRCNTDQTNWMDVGTACATMALCVASTATCTAPTCAPMQRQCSMAQPQRCNVDQNGWDDVGSPCATSALCSAGVCSDPVCAPGQKQCNLAQPQTCNSGRTGWDDDPMTCVNQFLCVNGSCVAPTCAVNEHRCSGAELQVCNAQRTGWQDQMMCASSPLCDATGGACIAPTCAATDYQCKSGVLQQCKVTLNGWDDKQTCTSQALCDAVNHECDDCIAPAYQCTAMNLLLACDTTGHFAMLADCGTGTCDETAGTCTP
jgi:hypothetical protein